MKKDISYKQAMEEIEKIISLIENEEPDVDELAGYVKRASELPTVCKTKLHKTEKDAEKIMAEIDFSLSDSFDDEN